MILWICFILCIIAALALDLGVFNRTPHVIEVKEAAFWSSLWVGIALLFAAVVFLAYANDWVGNPTELSPQNAVLTYLTGYLIELSLSIDNIFVIAIIFSSFSIPPKYRHEVLFYGILGAIVFRALMVVFGVALISKFEWMIYLFGAFLLYTAFQMLIHKSEDFDPKTSRMYSWIKKIFPATHEMEEDKFFINVDGKKLATPLFIALVVIELSDILFAVDSIPAILAITTDPFLAFSSNILAVLGLRSMFFLVSGMLEKFQYINYSLVAILAFVGVKMLLTDVFAVPQWLSISFIILALTVGIASSILTTEKNTPSQ